jgi:hypothetical protein
MIQYNRAIESCIVGSAVLGAIRGLKHRRDSTKTFGHDGVIKRLVTFAITIVK